MEVCHAGVRGEHRGGNAVGGAEKKKAAWMPTMAAIFEIKGNRKRKADAGSLGGIRRA